MFLTISLVIVDTRSSSFEAPQQGEVTGQTARCLFHRLDCVERSGTDISHTLSFCFPNVIELVQRIVRFVMRTEPKASYQAVQCKYTYLYTSYIYLLIFISVWWFYFSSIIYFILFKVTFISSYTFFFMFLVSVNDNNPGSMPWYFMMLQIWTREMHMHSEWMVYGWVCMCAQYALMNCGCVSSSVEKTFHSRGIEKHLLLMQITGQYKSVARSGQAYIV